MKLLYILGPTIMGGATISFKIILEKVIEEGCSVIILVSSKYQNKEFIDFLDSKGCIIETFNAETYIYPTCNLWGWQNSFVKFPWRFLRKLLYLASSNSDVLSIIKRHRPDIVHTNIGVFRQGYNACLKLGIPHLWHIREYQTKDFGWNILPTKEYYAKLLNRSNVICITKDIYEYFKLANNKSAVVLWNAILSKSEVSYNAKKLNFFLCANRISPEKKVEDAVAAFDAIAAKLPSDYKLIIVGEQHDKLYLKKLRRLIEASSCPDRIEIRQYQTDVTELMKDATSLIVSSKFEGLGRMTLEAIFKGCLVIGRATGGTKEILDETKGGFLFDTIEELSNSMLEVVNMKATDKYRSRIEYAQEVAVKRCSNENYNELIYDLYKNLI